MLVCDVYVIYFNMCCCVHRHNARPPIAVPTQTSPKCKLNVLKRIAWKKKMKTLVSNIIMNAYNIRKMI